VSVIEKVIYNFNDYILNVIATSLVAVANAASWEPALYSQVNSRKWNTLQLRHIRTSFVFTGQ